MAVPVPGVAGRAVVSALAMIAALGLAGPTAPSSAGVTSAGSSSSGSTSASPAGASPAGASPAGASADAAAGCGPAWVTGWQAAAEPAPAPADLAGATLRMIVAPQVTGSRVRIRLSNAYGTAPLVVGSASAARSDGAAGLVAGTARPVAFGGAAAVTIPAGGQVVSDAVPVTAQVGAPLAVSLFLPVRPAVITQHAMALQTSYVAHAGDAALRPDGGAFSTTIRSWMVLTGVDVLAARPENAVVTVGDSITDGLGSPADANQRWSDALAARLTAAGGAADMAVLNAGLSRNQLLAGDPTAGTPPLERFTRDVADATGATDVVLHIGTNDIAAGRGADAIEAGLVRFADRARAAGKRVFLTTITPSVTGPRATPAAMATRAAVNAWVLADGRQHADGMFDFAAAVADPARPDRLAAQADSGDGLHLSAAGYRALAAAVDVTAFTGSPCLAGSARVLAAGRGVATTVPGP